MKQLIKDKARQLGFFLAGATLPNPPPHYSTFEHWLAQGHHGNMNYLATERARARRANPREILPECKSILVLATPYSPPPPLALSGATVKTKRGESSVRVASYARAEDYHNILPARMEELVRFIEEQVAHPIKNRYYTDTGPILERDLAQRAGIGWIGKNTCLINPKQGSYFFLSEIFLDLELEPDPPFATDHCGTCARCITACPTDCILPNRTLDATRCISYLTIELKDDIPIELREKIGGWVFGCDICQMVCPWNRFSSPANPAFETKIPLPVLTSDLTLTSVEFNQCFKKSPIKRAKRRGYLRNLAIATGNAGNKNDIPILEQAVKDVEPLISEHAKWAKEKLERRL